MQKSYSRAVLGMPVAVAPAAAAWSAVAASEWAALDVESALCLWAHYGLVPPGFRSPRQRAAMRSELLDLIALLA